jgi:surface protein
MQYSLSYRLGANSGIGEKFDPDHFVVVVDTSLAAGATVRIPVNARTGVADRTIDWGDGAVETQNGANPEHTYAIDGEYTIKMYGATTTILGNSLSANWQQRVTRIVQWGKAIGWTNFTSGLQGCTQNVKVPKDIPRTEDGYAANVTNISNMFRSTNLFNQDIGLWNTAAVLNMTNLFFGASAFNQNIGSWNTAAVTNMAGIFLNASVFNQNIGSWNTASVTNMSQAFQGAAAFNQNIGSWSLRTASVTLTNMLDNCGMSTENYSRTLIGWANSVDANGDLPSGSTLGATGRTYNNTAYVSGQTYNDAVSARAYLTGAAPDPAWTISGDTQV